MSDVRLNAPDNQLWQNFVDSESLTVEQEAQFKRYQELLADWNERMNLTAITGLADIIDYHFRDSLALGHAIDRTWNSNDCRCGYWGRFSGYSA